MVQLTWIVYDKKRQPMAEKIRTWNKTYYGIFCDFLKNLELTHWQRDNTYLYNKSNPAKYVHKPHGKWI